MASDDNAGIVFPQEQNMVVGEIVISVEPILQSQVGVNVRGLGNEDGFFNILLCDLFDFGTVETGGSCQAAEGHSPDGQYGNAPAEDRHCQGFLINSQYTTMNSLAI